MRLCYASVFGKLPLGYLFRQRQGLLNIYGKVCFIQTCSSPLFDQRSIESSKSGIQEYLKHIVQQHLELTEILATSRSELKAEKRHAIGKTLAKYSPLVHIVKKMEKIREELEELEELLSGDGELKELAKEESLKYHKELNNLNDLMMKNLIPEDDDHNNDAILEVRAGTGGQEACLFTMEMFHMYQKFSSYKHWRFSTIRVNKSESGGFKEASASISGSDVFGTLKHETGVHRVQRVPATEAMGRLHTSTMTVAVLPEPEEIDVTLNQQDVKVDTFRASGAGGQHVNTTDSAVRITHLPTGIIVSNQDERSQIKNKQKALRILRAKLFQLQRETADQKRSVSRRQQIGTGERSEKIRTYNFPQNRVTDHRVGMSCNNVDEFLKGECDLQHMITELQSHYQTMALNQIFEHYTK